MPSGKNKIAMSDLRDLLSKHQFNNVSTYIHTGNIILQSSLSPQEIEQIIYKLIKHHIGANLTVIARTPSQIEKVLDDNPYPTNYDRKRIFYCFLSTKPTKELVDTLLHEDFADNELEIINDTVYMYIPGDMSRSKLNNNYVERRLKTSATTRNNNTLNKMLSKWKKEYEQ